MAGMLPNGRASGSSIKVHGLRETVQKLQGLSAALVGKNGGPIRKALFQAAKVIEIEAERLSPKATGRLERNIIKMRNRNPRATQGAPVELYHVGVRGGGAYGARRRQRARKKVLGAGGSARQAQRAAVADDKDAYYWRFIEFGTAKMPARPFLRPAFDSKKEEAVRVFAAILKRDVDAIERSIL